MLQKIRVVRLWEVWNLLYAKAQQGQPTAERQKQAKRWDLYDHLGRHALDGLCKIHKITFASLRQKAGFCTKLQQAYYCKLQLKLIIQIYLSLNWLN
jgi:hypothetical protein